jgi:predicted DNA-binding transcriptional regulator AlpA
MSRPLESIKTESYRATISSEGLEVMTLEEAAQFLRFSRSTMYQRHDIPRHRVPGSTAIRYLRSELLSWLKGDYAARSPTEGAEPVHAQSEVGMDIGHKPLYHRNARYR